MRALFSDAVVVAAALRFEKALTAALVESRLVSESHGAIVVAAIDGMSLDESQLMERAHHAGTLAIPLVEEIRGVVAATVPEAAQTVHLGSTSQDVADSVMAMQLHQATRRLDDLATAVCDKLADIALEHIDTPVIGRTLMRRALPVTFGLRVCHWLSPIAAARARLRSERARLSVQFGGPVGNYSGLQGKGEAITRFLAEQLELACPETPWHTQRIDVVALGTSIALLAASVAKFARDVALLAQDEMGELGEKARSGRGGSSAMAHKRNPTTAQQILLAGKRVSPMLQTLHSGLLDGHEYERGLAGWQLEFPLLAEMCVWTDDAMVLASRLAADLEVDSQAMADNLPDGEPSLDVGESADIVRRTLAQYRRGDE